MKETQTKQRKVRVVKEVVRLRQKEVANGSSLYLDIYWKGQREYEFLNLYLIDATTQSQRQQNKETMILAEQIKARRLLDLQSGKHKLSRTKLNESFLKYFQVKIKDRFNSKGNHDNWKCTYKHLLKFTKNKDVSFADVDENFLLRFKHFLLNETLSRGKRKLSQNSCHSYFNKVKAALREAYNERLIIENPASRIKGIKAGETKREFLSWEEVEKIAQAPCDVTKLKEAFLFSVLTGLRWSDIQKLTWGEVRGSETEGWFIRYQQQKTKDFEVLPITNEARTLLGETRKSDERVFTGLKYSAHMNLSINRWMLRAGIYRNITFHCARHTHATLLLTQGVDIYVVSKLLGHKDIKTTEIYTRVTNLKKNEAIQKIPKLNVSK